MPLPELPDPQPPILPPEERARRIELLRKGYEDHPYRDTLIQFAETNDKALARMWKAYEALEKFNADYAAAHEHCDLCVDALAREPTEENQEAWAASKRARAALKAENEAINGAVEELLVIGGIVGAGNVRAEPAADVARPEPGTRRQSKGAALTDEQMSEVLQEVVQGTSLRRIPLLQGSFDATDRVLDVLGVGDADAADELNYRGLNGVQNRHWRASILATANAFIAVHSTPGVRGAGAILPPLPVPGNAVGGAQPAAGAAVVGQGAALAPTPNCRRQASW